MNLNLNLKLNECEKFIIIQLDPKRGCRLQFNWTKHVTNVLLGSAGEA